MIKNVKFSYTVSAKAFSRRIAELLQQQITESNIYEDIENGIEHLKTEDYELFFAYLANAKAELELISLSLNDAEENVRGFLQANQPSQAQPEQPAQQVQQNTTENVPQDAPANSVESQKNAFEQLKQLESLVNVMKELRGSQQP